jgi:integrase
MARRLTESPLTTPNARKKLSGLHWRQIDPDIHLGYRSAGRGGKWLVRWYKGNQKYRQEGLATADDNMPADGLNVLSFYQAETLAKRVVADRRLEAIAALRGEPVTIKDAIDEYLASKDKQSHERGEGQRSDIRRRFTRHVLSDAEFSAIAVFRLTESDLEGWKKRVGQNVVSSSLQRIVNDLKAALNKSAHRHRAVLPADLPNIIARGLAVDRVLSEPQARHDQALPDHEVRLLVEAARSIDQDEDWGGDLHRLVAVLAATGARFSQAARLRVGDVQVSHKRIMIPVSRKGKGQKSSSHIGVSVSQDVIDLLLPVITGRKRSDVLLERWYSKQISPTVWIRSERDHWRSSSLMDRPWARIVNRAGLTRPEGDERLVPYALRHSSIVRALRKGMPVRLVAALHDTSTEEIEMHYSAEIVDVLHDVVAEAAITLQIDKAPVTRLRRRN